MKTKTKILAKKIQDNWTNETDKRIYCEKCNTLWATLVHKEKMICHYCYLDNIGVDKKTAEVDGLPNVIFFTKNDKDLRG